MQKVQSDGKIWFGSAMWRGEECFKISICSAETTEDHIKVTLQVIKEAIEK
jgi:hypothetical protein